MKLKMTLRQAAKCLNLASRLFKNILDMVTSNYIEYFLKIGPCNYDNQKTH